MRVGKIGAVAATVSAAAALVVGGSGNAFADGDVTWTNVQTGRCLSAEIAFDQNVFADCKSGPFNRTWHDVHNGDGSWLELGTDGIDDGLCLTGYKDTSIYLEKCANPANNWERWRETHLSNGYWVLQNVATGLCLDSNDSGSVYGHACISGDRYQMWK